VPAIDDDTLPAILRMFDMLYRDRRVVRRVDILSMAEVMSLPPEVLSLFTLLPPGSFTRRSLSDQLNSVIVGHGLSRSLGTVE
jgi:hypothetical protein